MDEIDYELSKCEVEDQSESQTFACKVSNFFNATFSSFNRKIDSGMKQVLDKLEYLASQKGALGLKRLLILMLDQEVKCHRNCHQLLWWLKVLFMAEMMTEK